MLEDFGSKMEFSWLSWAMFGHLGAKVSEQGRETLQLSEKVGFLEGGGDATQGPAMASDGSQHPPLRNSKGRGWSSHLHQELPTPTGNS